LSNPLRTRSSPPIATVTLRKDGFQDVGKGPGSRAGEFIEWLAFSNPDQAVIDDVARIRNHPLVPSTIPIHGYIYDVKTGKLNEVHEATKLGKSHASK
jgi:carbonic anhydrase